MTDLGSHTDSTRKSVGLVELMRRMDVATSRGEDRATLGEATGVEELLQTAAEPALEFVGVRIKLLLLRVGK